MATLIFRFIYKGSLDANFHNEIYRLASFDGLTQVYNRKHCQELLEKELSRAQRNKSSLAVVMMDIDHFKKINDTCGHQAGDCVLRSLAKKIQDNIRKGDIFGRFGGERIYF